MSSNPTPFIPAKLDQANLTPQQFRVFCRISRRGDCTESVGNIASSIGVHPDTVRSAMKTLVEANMISREVRPGTTCLHKERPPSEWDLSALEEEETEVAEGNQNDDTPPENEGGDDYHPCEMNGDHPWDINGGVPYEMNGGVSKGNPFEGAKRVSAADAPLLASLRQFVDRISWETEPLPDDHPARWEHLPGDWTFDFALAALEHFRELDLLATPTRKKIDREGEQRVAAQWADTFRLLKEQDGYERAEIKATMEWLFDGGNFWIEKQAVRSVPPLRTKTGSGDAYKFDVMHQQAHSESDEHTSRDDAKQRPDENWKRISRAAAAT